MTLRTVIEPGRVASGALAVLVHLMFFGLLVFGVSWQKKITSPVVVDLWQDLPEPVKKVALPPEPPKPVPKIAPQLPKPVPEVRKEPVPPPPAPKVETPKPSAADIELKEKLRKQKEEEAERQEEQRKAEAERKEEQKKAELEKRRLEEEQRAEEQKRADEQRRVEEARRDDERKQRAAAAERERLQQEAARKQREAEESRRRVEAAARAAQDKLVADFVAKITAKVKGRVVLPPNIEGNPQAEFDVVLIPGGEVLEVKRRKSSGNPAYDDAVERAINAAQPLPVPDGDLFQERFRQFVLKFRPKE